MKVEKDNRLIETVNSNVVATMSRRMFIRSALGMSFSIPFLPSLLSSGFAYAQNQLPVPSSAIIFLGMSGYNHGRFFKLDRNTIEPLMIKQPTGARTLDLRLLKELPADKIGPVFSFLRNYLDDLHISVGHSYISTIGAEAHDNMSKAMTGYSEGYLKDPLNYQSIKSLDSYVVQKFNENFSLKANKFDVVDLGGIFAGNPFDRPIGRAISGVRKLSSASGNYTLMSMYDSLFGSINPGDANAARTRLNRDTVLNALLESYRSVKSKVGSSDRISLEAHVDGLAEITKQNKLISSCEVSPKSTTQDPAVDIIVDQSPLSTLMNQLTAGSLACGVSRVFIYDMGPYSSAWHGWSHGLEAQSADAMTKGIINSQLKTMAHLGDLLKDRINPNTGKSLFYETSMSFQSEFGSTTSGGLFSQSFVGNTHEHSLHGNLMLLLGGHNGRVNNGKLVNWFDEDGYYKNQPFTSSPGTLRNGQTLGLCAQQQVLATYLRGVFDVPAEQIYINGNFGHMGYATHPSFPGLWDVPDVSIAYGRKKTDLIPHMLA
jgi:hypothetical protein